MSARRRSWIPLGAFLLLGAACAQAGEYRLVEEHTPLAPKPGSSELKPYDQLCESVVAALNRMEPVQPMICGIEFPPAAAEVNTPDWKPIDPKEHMALLREIARVRDTHLTAEEIRSKWAKHESYIESGNAQLWRARFDLNNERGKEIVLRHDLWGCDAKNPVSRNGGQQFGIAVLEEFSDALNEVYWRLHERPYYHPFFYGGRTWLWRWRGWDNDAEVAVYQAGFARNQFGWYNHASCKIDYVTKNSEHD